jgi:crotonobetaine/carnitine-CoA ligase
MALSIEGLLASRARDRPNACFLRFSDQNLTFDEVHRWSNDLANGLAALGVRRGHLVPLLMPNRPEFVVSCFALCKLGAVATLINTAMRGPALIHAINLSEAEIAIVDESLLVSIEPIRDQLVHLQRLVVTSGSEAGATMGASEKLRFATVAFADVAATERCELPSVIGEHDPAMVMFTSGTTGPSKGCVLSHRYAVRQAELLVEHLHLRDDDVLYCPFPLFHLDATVLTVMAALVLGATAAISARFSASRFWPEVRSFGATVFDFMGATLTMLHKLPPAPDDIDNRVRLAWGVPVPDFAAEFEARFGLRLIEVYGSTDAGVPIYHPLDEPRRPGSCGRAIPSYDVRLFDESDIPVPLGEVGEIVLRPNEPSLMSQGYYGMPEATVAATRDLWFHTGDLARQDHDGYFYFVGRRAESIRRRGENISAFEIEEVVKLHPRVIDAAAFGVPSELTEDDVMIAVVPKPGECVDPAELIEFCRERMARHMLPRYVDLLSELPRTPTEKVAKRFLIERGVTPSTWDRERTD